jgi:hypothetical protein
MSRNAALIPTDFTTVSDCDAFPRQAILVSALTARIPDVQSARLVDAPHQ